MSFLNPKSLFKSFNYAFRGVIQVFREEQNFRFQVLLGSLVLILAVWLRVQIWEAVVLILVIVLVLVLELINSIFERLVDVLKPRIHPYVQTIKDIMAATVLIASFGAVVIGILIFGPYLF
jgi:diacylglycerol kinase